MTIAILNIIGDDLVGVQTAATVIDTDACSDKGAQKWRNWWRLTDNKALVTKMLFLGLICIREPQNTLVKFGTVRKASESIAASG